VDHDIFYQKTGLTYHSSTGDSLSLIYKSDIIKNHYHLRAFMNSDLNRLGVGESGDILAIEADEALHHRLLALGFRHGKRVTVMRVGIFHGPLQVAIGTTQVILRRADAAKILIERTA